MVRTKDPKYILALKTLYKSEIVQNRVRWGHPCVLAEDRHREGIVGPLDLRFRVGGEL